MDGPQDISELMRVSEYASLAAFARAVLARAVADDPRVANLTVACDIDGGEIVVAGAFHDSADTPIAGFGV